MDKNSLLQRLSDIEWSDSFGIMSEKPVEGTSVNSFNKASYRNFRDYLKRIVPELHYNKLEDDTFNQKLKLVKDGKLTYGGLLFLGENIEIQNHISDFRVDYLEIPATSYADAEPRYTFRIQNPGSLPRPIEELMKEDVSIPRNPVLAKLFRIAKLCESAGYGFDKMLVWKRETRNEVIFETSIDKTKVTFMLKEGKLNLSGKEKTTQELPENNTENNTENNPCNPSHPSNNENLPINH